MQLSVSTLNLLICPETSCGLRPAQPELVAELNNSVKNGALKTRSGSKVERSLIGALVREDGKVVYPIIDGIPTILIGDAIEISK